MSNSFAVDKINALANLSPEKAAVLNNLLDSFITGGQGREFDLSKPPVVPYDPNRLYPKMVYHHTTGHVLTIHNEQQFELAKKKGFSDKPSPEHDYSKIKNGIAERKPYSEPRTVSLEASDLEKELADEQERERVAAATAEAEEALAAFPDAEDGAGEETGEPRPTRKRR